MSEQTKILMWGDATIQTAELDERGRPKAWKTWGKPAEGTVKLSVTKGNKQELKTEGGAVEAIRRSANTYTLEFELRMGHDTELPVSFVDGVCQGVYALRLQGEDKAAKGIRIDKCYLSSEDSADMNEGYKIKVTADAVRPEAGNTVKYEIIDLLATNSLQVLIIGDEGKGAWRIVGESNWRASGEVAYIAGTGSKTIEYRALEGKTLPSESAETSVQITGAENAIVAKYK